MISFQQLSERLKQIVEPFRFRKHARERAAAERQAEREHQLEVIDTMLARVVKIVEHTKDGAVAQAQSTQELAQTLGTWLAMFKSANDEQAHVGSATVRPADEHEAEIARERDRLRRKGYPVDGTPAQQLMWLQDNDEF